MTIRQGVTFGDSVWRADGFAGITVARGGPGNQTEQLVERLAAIAGIGPVLSPGLVIPDVLDGFDDWDVTGWTSAYGTNPGTPGANATAAWAKTTDVVSRSGYATLADAAVYTLPARFRRPVGFALYFMDVGTQGSWSTDGGTTWHDFGQTLASDNKIMAFYVASWNTTTNKVWVRAADAAGTARLVRLVGIQPWYVDPGTATQGIIWHNFARNGWLLRYLLQMTDAFAMLDSVKIGTGHPIPPTPNFCLHMPWAGDYRWAATTTQWAADLDTYWARTHTAAPDQLWSIDYEFRDKNLEPGGVIDHDGYYEPKMNNYRAVTRAKATANSVRSLVDFYTEWYNLGSRTWTRLRKRGFVQNVSNDNGHPTVRACTEIADRLYREFGKPEWLGVRHIDQPLLGRTALSGGAFPMSGVATVENVIAPRTFTDRYVRSNRPFAYATGTRGVEPRKRTPNDPLLQWGRVVKYDPPPKVKPPPPPPPGAPATPTGLHKTGATTTTIDLAWNANVEADLAGYWVSRQMPGGVWQRQGSMIPAGTTVTTIGGLAAGQSYWVRITAVDTESPVNESPPSVPIPVKTAAVTQQKPAAPAKPNADPTDTTVVLNWPDVADADSYQVYRKVGADWVIEGAIVTVSQKTVSGLTASTQYTFRVTASNEAGESDPSPSVTFTTDASTPPPSGRLIVVPYDGPDGTWDPTGVIDMTDKIAAFVNSVTVGTGAGTMVTIRFTPTWPNGTTRTQYRVDGGVNGGGLLGACNWIRFDGGATPGQRGLNGVLFSQRNGIQRDADPSAHTAGLLTASALTGTQSIAVGTTSGFANLGRLVIGDGATPWEVTYNGKDGTHFHNCRVTVGSGTKASGSDVTPNYFAPFTIEPSASNPGGSPSGEWDVIWKPRYGDPAEVIKSTRATQSIATGARNDLNRHKSMWRPQECTGLLFQRCHFRGSYEGGPMANDFVNNDCWEWQGCTDSGWMDCTIHNFAGQVFETTAHDSNNHRTKGLWGYRSDMKRTGRQIASVTYGEDVILEECFLSDSQRTILDVEPIAHATDERAPFFVDGLFILDCVIGNHNLGMLALHPGVRRVRVSGNTGQQVGSSGVNFAEKIIYHDNVSHSGPIPSQSFDFGRSVSGDDDVGNRTGRDFGGRDIMVRNNDTLCNTVGVRIAAGTGGRCENYHIPVTSTQHPSAVAEPARANVFKNGNGNNIDPVWVDGTPVGGRWDYTTFSAAWLDGTDENGRPTLAIPAHALRDLIIP